MHRSASTEAFESSLNVEVKDSRDARLSALASSCDPVGSLPKVFTANNACATSIKRLHEHGSLTPVFNLRTLQRQSAALSASGLDVLQKRSQELGPFRGIKAKRWSKHDGLKDLRDLGSCGRRRE